MSELPEGWALATVGDTGDYINGKAFKPSDWEETGKPIIRIQNLTDPTKPINRTTQIVDDRFLVSSGDILVAWSASLGVHLWEGEKAVVNQHIFKVVPQTELVEQKFLFYGLKEAIAELIQSEHLHGSTMKHINRKPFLAHPFPVPPKPEQKRIAAKINSLTARSARARTELTKIELLVERYKGAVIDTEIRKAESTGATASSVEEIAETTFDGPFGSNLKSADYVDAGKRVIRLENIGHFAFIGSKETFISDEKFFSLKRHHLKADDILFSSFISDNIRVCRLPGYLEGQALNKADCFAIRLDRELADPGYIMFALGSTKAFTTLSGSVHGATRPRINLKQLKSYVLPVPPISAQRAAIARIETALRHIEQVVEELRGSTTALDQVDEQVLAKAFAGRLVPQDPNDEAATELLARIKTARENAPKKPRQRRQGGKTKVSTVQKLKEALASWPEGGLTFEELRRNLPGTYEAQKDAIFDLLSSDPPKLRQEFDEDDQIMKLKKV